MSSVLPSTHARLIQKDSALLALAVNKSKDYIFYSTGGTPTADIVGEVRTSEKRYE